MLKYIGFAFIIFLTASALNFSQKINKLPETFSAYSFENLQTGKSAYADLNLLIADPQKKILTTNQKNKILRRFIPASTFKILNSIIALETGVADSSDFAIKWDSSAVPRKRNLPHNWFRDQTLKSAFNNSVLWFYQELARRTGAARMKCYVEKFNYGNENVSGGIDQFWLRGGLRISPVEQTDFLKRFYFSELNISGRTEKIVKDIMLIEETPEYTLSGKSGTGKIDDGVYIAWLVGFLEKEGDVYFYSFNVNGKDVFSKYPFAERKKIVKNFFIKSGILK